MSNVPLKTFISIYVYFRIFSSFDRDSPYDFHRVSTIPGVVSRGTLAWALDMGKRPFLAVGMLGAFMTFSTYCSMLRCCTIEA